MNVLVRCFAILWWITGCHAGQQMGMMTSSPTVFPTETPKPTPLASQEPSPAPTITPQPTPLESEEPTMTPTTLAPTPLESEEPTMTPTTLAPTPLESEEPTMTPTTLAPTPLESEEPTMTPTTLAPSISPSGNPTFAPTTMAPTAFPTVSPAPTISPQPTATPTTQAPTASAAPTMAPTLPRIPVELAELNMEVSVEEGAVLDPASVDRSIQTFLEEHLQVQYDPSFGSVQTQTEISAKEVVEPTTTQTTNAESGTTFIITTQATALFDPEGDNTPSIEDVESSVSDYISTGGDKVLEEALQTAGVGEIRSITLDGEIVPLSAPATMEPQVFGRSSRSGISSPGAIVGITMGGVFLCAVLALVAAKFSKGGGGGGDDADSDAAAPQDDSRVNEPEENGTFEDAASPAAAENA